MKSRLSITVNEKLLKGAKRYAERHNTSISRLIEGYFKRITRSGRKNIVDLIESLPKTRSGSGEDVKKRYYEDKKKKIGF